MHNRAFLLRGILEGLAAAQVIDIGCGEGGYSPLISSQLNASLIVGVDLSKKELRLAKLRKTHANEEYVRADANALPFVTSTFDLVLSKDLLHHLSNPLATLREFRKLLKSNGLMVIVESERNNPLMRMYIKYGHNHFTLPQLSTLAREAGLRDHKVKQISAYPHHLLFWSGRPIEASWDLCAIVFLALCHILPRVVPYFLRLIQMTSGPSYNVIFWGRKC